MSNYHISVTYDGEHIDGPSYHLPLCAQPSQEQVVSAALSHRMNPPRVIIESIEFYVYKQKDKKLNNKNIKQRSKARRTVIAEVDDDETENGEEIKIRKKLTPNKRKTSISKQEQFEEPISKKLRSTTALHNKSTYWNSTKLQKINERNTRIGEKIQSLRSHQAVLPTLPSPIRTRSTNGKQDVFVAPAQNSSPVRIKTASRVTFALPRPVASPILANVFYPIHPSSP
ncbi:unnamed protein product [Rotaria sp. Silwood2]|nr:unnamed protein product [Rotaria sp. Silwood2]